MIRGVCLDGDLRRPSRDCDHVTIVIVRKIETGYKNEDDVHCVLHCLDCNCVVYGPVMWCMPTFGRVELHDSIVSL